MLLLLQSLYKIVRRIPPPNLRPVEKLNILNLYTKAQSHARMTTEKKQPDTFVTWREVIK